MTIIADLPIVNGDTLAITFELGRMLFVLGANGAGKSSLMFKLNRPGTLQRLPAPSRPDGTAAPTEPVETEWITAHRPNSYDSSALGTFAQVQQNMVNLRSNFNYSSMRWSKNLADNLSFFPLVRFVAHQRQQIDRRYEAIKSAPAEALRITSEATPLEVVNELLLQANLNIQLFIDQNDTVMATRGHGEAYPFPELSDGERSALNLISQVISAKPGTVLLIDEPERHLHRAITVPLLKQLFDWRDDCFFVISTHELGLPLAMPQSAALLVRGVEYGPGSQQLTMLDPVAWNATYLPTLEQLDEDLRRDVLGARQNILFVEGVSTSLDVPLYGLLFPDVTVIPKSDCKQVEAAVRGVRGVYASHDLNAFGLIDADDRTQDQQLKLQQERIYVLPVRTVESVYYHPKVLEAVADYYCPTAGLEPVKVLEAAKAVMLSELTKSRTVFAQHIVDSQVRQRVMQHFPSKEALERHEPVDIHIDVEELFLKEEGRLQALINAQDLAGLIERYPIRRSGALKLVAEAFGFKDREGYERVVLKTLRQKPSAEQLEEGKSDALTLVRNWFGPLIEALH